MQGLDGGEALGDTYVSVPVDFCIKSIRGSVCFLLQHTRKQHFHILKEGNKDTASLTMCTDPAGLLLAMAAAAGAAASSCAPAHQPYPTAFPSSGNTREPKGFFFVNIH